MSVRPALYYGIQSRKSSLLLASTSEFEHKNCPDFVEAYIERVITKTTFHSLIFH